MKVCTGNPLPQVNIAIDGKTARINSVDGSPFIKPHMRDIVEVYLKRVVYGQVTKALIANDAHIVSLDFTYQEDGDEKTG